MSKLLYAVICIVIAGYGWRCSKSGPQQVMGGVENGNGFITGYLYTQEGIPAKNTAVRIIPFYSDPRVKMKTAS